MYILTYGSLRKGCYNFNYFDMEYIETLEIEGYDLYSFGAYPGINKGTGKLTVDLMKVSRATESMIDGMEWSAGYIDEKIEVISEVLQQVVSGKIYIYADDLSHLKHRKVESGNWITYLNKQKENAV